jgi:DNA-binding transcriptional LysR family regulator
MEMHQIRYFLALCEEGKFTRAATRCGVAQPSLTNAIKQLEAELGGPLFHRSKAGTCLTPFGAALRRHFERIAESAAAIEADARSKSVPQSSWRKELAMSRNLLLSAVVLLPLIGIGSFVWTSTPTGPRKSEPVSATTLDPQTLHLGINVSALPETEIKEPF